ncbi:hypothetical protein ACVWZ3_002332 [Bradyrhizobium sp. i1.3.6]
MMYSSSLIRKSGLIGTTDTPSPFSANHSSTNAGLFWSSSPTLWPSP